MTIPLNLQPSDDDLELLSAYIDEQLAAEERRALDERIGREVRRLYLFDGPRCDRMVERVFAALAEACIK